MRFDNGKIKFQSSLPPEEWIRMENDFDPSILQKSYASPTPDWMKELWENYCSQTKKDPRDAIRNPSIETLLTFFRWMLDVRRETIHSEGTLRTYWNAFCQHREQVAHRIRINQTVRKQFVDTIPQLATEFRLEKKRADKSIMRAEDEFEILKTLWYSPDMKFPHERYRTQLALILQLAGITGNRPTALLSLTYRDVRATLFPGANQDDPPRLLLELIFRYTKSYLGSKDANTFAVPQVPLEPCLLLCANTTFLALAFGDEAFANPSLREPEHVYRLKIPSEARQLELPWKESVLDMPIFRQAVQTIDSYKISLTKAFPSATLRNQLQRLALLTGLDVHLKPYCFRRGNGLALERSGEISDAQRNLILQHKHNSGVFQQSYLSRYIDVDTQAIYRNLQPQTDLLRMASGMSRTIDSRRPTKLNERQMEDVQRHPEVRLLYRRQQHLYNCIKTKCDGVSRTKAAKLDQEYAQACITYQNKRKQILRQSLSNIRAQFNREQAILDIEDQLGGMKSRITQSPRKISTFVLPERFVAIDALFVFAPTSVDAERKGRTEAIQALADLSLRQEGSRLILRQSPGSQNDHSAVYWDALPMKRREQKERKDEIAPNVQVSTIQVIKDPLKCEPTQCIFCLGAKELPLEQRERSFCKASDLKKHWDRRHIPYLSPDQPISCPHPQCKAVLQHVNHLKNHAVRVHKTSL